MTQLKTLKIPFADWITTHEARGFLFMNDIEVWVEIKGYEGLYEVSHFGRVRSCEKKANFGNRIRVRKERIMKLQTHPEGYQIISLSKNNKRRSISVHLLVANAFLMNTPDNGLVVDHKKNKNRLDNSVYNLQLITQRKNASKDKDKTKTTSKYIGVILNKRDNNWTARIRIKGKPKFLGNFENEIDASNAYQYALSKLK